MITYDFSNDSLLPREKRMLFWLRFLYRVPESYFGDSFRDLYEADYIKPNYSDESDPFNTPIKDGTYSLSNKYYRYISYRRDRFFHGSVWPCVISCAISGVFSLTVSIIVAVITR